MSAQPEHVPPDMAKLRREFEEEKRRVQKAGDPASIARLEELELRTEETSYWDGGAPSVRDQLVDHLKRLGIE